MNYTSKEVYEYISQQTGDPIVKWKICRVSGQEFAIYQSDLDFYERISPVFSGKKYLIPTPTLCPEERQRRRLMFRNYSNFYRQQSLHSGKNVITNHAPELGIPVLFNHERWSDGFDATTYGEDIQETTSFSDQYLQLQQRVPDIALMNDDGIVSENCIYTHDVNYSKNCYYLFSAWYSENVLYGYQNCNHDTNCCDLTISNNCEWCYEVVQSQYCTNSTFLIGCEHADNCHFSYNLKHCSHCFLCDNLTNAKYYYKNKQYSPTEWKCLVAQHQLETRSGQHMTKELFHELLDQKKIDEVMNMKCEDVYGHGNFESGQCTFLYSFRKAFDSKYLFLGDQARSSRDLSNVGMPELCYEGLTPDESFQTHFSIFTRSSKYMLYCDMCHSCEHCFGCIGLKNKKYCIFNKQYTKEEYERLVPLIIQRMQQAGTWGEFFDFQLSPFAYNDTIAGTYYPPARVTDISGQTIYENKQGRGTITLEASEGFAKGSRDLGGEECIPVIRKIEKQSVGDSNNQAIPDSIHDVSDDIVQQTIVCEETGKPFRVLKQELAFYRKMNLPVPIIHPDERFRQRCTYTPMNSLSLKQNHLGEEYLSIYP